MSINLTESAAERVRGYLADGNGQGLRFGVRKTGCSGFAYVVDIAEEPRLMIMYFRVAALTYLLIRRA